jgi:hypothetical protein
MVNGDHLQGMEWIQEDTKRDYIQKLRGKNALVVGDGGNGENLSAMRIQGRRATMLAGR